MSDEEVESAILRHLSVLPHPDSLGDEQWEDLAGQDLSDFYLSGYDEDDEDDEDGDSQMSDSRGDPSEAGSSLVEEIASVNEGLPLPIPVVQFEMPFEEDDDDDDDDDEEVNMVEEAEEYHREERGRRYAEEEVEVEAEPEEPGEPDFDPYDEVYAAPTYPHALITGLAGAHLIEELTQRGQPPAHMLPEEVFVVIVKTQRQYQSECAVVAVHANLIEANNHVLIVFYQNYQHCIPTRYRRRYTKESLVWDAEKQTNWQLTDNALRLRSVCWVDGIIEKYEVKVERHEVHHEEYRFENPAPERRAPDMQGRLELVVQNGAARLVRRSAGA